MGKDFVKKLASVIESAYQSYGICVNVRFYTISSNNQNLIFKLIPELGTRVDAIFERAEDIKMALQISLFHPFKEEARIFLAFSIKPVMENRLLRMLNSPAFRNSPALLPIVLGYDLMGRMVIEDLEILPHAMYVGATRSGKSTGLICLVLSLVCKHSANEVNLVILDIGGRTLDALKSIPHLSRPIVKDEDTGIHTIQTLYDEMERRYTLNDSELSLKPAIVCIIDEYVSFIGNISNKKKRSEVSNHITNILRRGRKIKIHMVLATQNPTDKAMEAEMGNITARMAFKVARLQTSITVLNNAGAEKLPGNGAMLYTSMAHPEPIYIQGANISAEEIEQLTTRIIAANQVVNNRFAIPEYIPPEDNSMADILPDEVHDNHEKQQEFAKIILWALSCSDLSVEQIKRTFSMGNRANGIMDELYKIGLVSEKFANQPRQVLPQSMGDIPETVLQFLINQGFSNEVINAAINKRPQ